MNNKTNCFNKIIIKNLFFPGSYYGFNLGIIKYHIIMIIIIKKRGGGSFELIEFYNLHKIEIC